MKVRSPALASVVVGHVELEPLLLGVRLCEEVDAHLGALLTKPAGVVLPQRQVEGQPGDDDGDDGCDAG
jgi:hypothetical protein